MSESALSDEFEAARGKRGKARDAALAAFVSHGDAAIPVLARALHDESKPKRDLAQKLLRELRPTTAAGRVAVVSATSDLWQSSKAALRAAGCELAPLAGEAMSALSAPLARLLASEYDAEVLSAALGLSAAMHLEREALAATLDPVLDHWSAPMRGRAREILVAAGATPRAGRWDDCPLANAVVQHVQRLGGAPKPFDPSAPRRGAGCSWACNERPQWRGDDPLGQLKAMPAAAEFFDYNIEWRRGKTFGTWDRDFPDRTMDLTATSENADTQVQGQRRLLYAIGYCSLQYYYCLDLLTPGDDPPVYIRDHGSLEAYVKFPTLSRFLAWLKTP